MRTLAVLTGENNNIMANGIYKPKVKRDKGYGFKDGKLVLGKEEQVYGPQNDPSLDPKASPVDKAGLVSDARKKEAERAKATMDEETGEITLNPQNEPQQDPLDYSSDPKATQQFLKDKGYLKGSVDGKFGPGSKKALNDYYAFEGVEPPNAKKLQGILEEMGAVIKEKPDNYDTIGGKKPSYATNELSSGGDVSPELIDSIETYMKPLEVPGLRITAGNDAYHQGDRYSNPGKSAHSKGKALDFTTDDPQAVRDALISNKYKKRITYKEDGKTPKYIYYVSPDGSHRILDEYAVATKNTTGGHFDWKVY